MQTASANQAASLLEARGLGRRQREGVRWLLRDISLAIHAGDRIALTGPTGSGKTVLLRSLCMLDVLDDGVLLWNGESPSPDTVPAYRSRAIYLTQRPRLFHGTVEQNLRVPYAMAVHRHRKFSQQNIERYLRRLGRDELFLTRNSAHLSGGETQIVAILRAMQLDPTLLLLDEPTASLDERTTQQIEQLVTDWISPAETRRAFVWVTHSAAQAQRIANRIWHLRDGELIESETDP